MTLLSGFTERRFEAEGVEINAAIAGSGPPLLLLHGYPQTHAMWHRIAPRLAERFTVVAPDLRGYGDSAKPEQVDSGGGNYAKRIMAADMVAVMADLGHDRFRVAGHDRGARVAYRMALDSPERVERLALLDIVPTKTVFDRIDANIAAAYFHWFFLARPRPLPETMIGADPGFWLDTVFGAWSGASGAFTSEALAEYHRCFGTPEGVHASCADYRAGAGIDRQHDAADLAAGRHIECPVLLLWGKRGLVGQAYGDPLEVWRAYAPDLRGHGVPGGHFLPEEAPEETLSALLDFMG